VGQHDQRAARVTLPPAEPEYRRLLDESTLAIWMLASETGVERSLLVLLADSNRVLDEQRDAAHRVRFELFQPVQLLNDGVDHGAHGRSFLERRHPREEVVGADLGLPPNQIHCLAV
jgi:hypothetical protein